MPTSEKAETKEPPSHDRPLRILIVDDNPDMREMMVLMVRRLRYAVATAPTGTEALAHVRAQQVDIIDLLRKS
jgi:CheY-like chemotaxis protein